MTLKQVFDEHKDPKTGDPCGGDHDLSDLAGKISTAFGQSQEFWKEMMEAENDDAVIIAEEEEEEEPCFASSRTAPSLNAAGELVDEEPFVDFVIRTFRKPLEINPDAEKEKAKIDAERAGRRLFNNYNPRQVRMSSISYRTVCEDEYEDDDIKWWFLLERIRAFPMGINPEAEKEKAQFDFERRNRPKPTFVPKRISIDHEYMLHGKTVFPCEYEPYSFSLDDLLPPKEDVVEVEASPSVTACVEVPKPVEVAVEEPKPEEPKSVEAKQGWCERLFNWLRRK